MEITENTINTINTAAQILEPEQRYRQELKRMIEELMKLAEAKRANDILAVHVGDRTIVADWFVFMSGTSQIHVKALCDELEDRAAELGFILRRREGYNEGRWIVLDFSSVLVHIFHPEEREYYNVERLWMDPAADVIRIDDQNQ